MAGEEAPCSPAGCHGEAVPRQGADKEPARLRESLGLGRSLTLIDPLDSRAEQFYRVPLSPEPPKR